ncbi:MAG: hypothetical protein JO257_33390 [Deltaproteobacteria bacterium]|nr:hypothetical protein [Deltaproteobacteria bacterium]
MRAVVGAAMRRALGVWIGCGIVAAVLLGPTGIQPRDLTGLALHDPAAGAVLAATWLLLFVPIARVLVRADAAAYLRALPIGPTWPLAAAALLALQLPWLALWIVGDGVRGLAVVGVVTLLVIPLAAWRPIRRRARVPVWRDGGRAFAGIYARAIVRRGGDAIVRGIGLSLLAGITGALLVRNNHLDGAHGAALASAVIAVVLVPAVLGVLLPLADAHRSAAPLAASLAVTTRAPLAAVVTSAFVVAALVAGGLAAVVTDDALVVPVAVATAIGSGLFVTPALGKQPANLVTTAVVAAAFAILWLGWLGAIGAMVCIATGAVALARAA